MFTLGVKGHGEDFALRGKGLQRNERNGVKGMAWGYFSGVFLIFLILRPCQRLSGFTEVFMVAQGLWDQGSCSLGTMI